MATRIGGVLFAPGDREVLKTPTLHRLARRNVLEVFTLSSGQWVQSCWKQQSRPGAKIGHVTKGTSTQCSEMSWRNFELGSRPWEWSPTPGKCPAPGGTSEKLASETRKRRPGGKEKGGPKQERERDQITVSRLEARAETRRSSNSLLVTLASSALFVHLEKMGTKFKRIANPQSL